MVNYSDVKPCLLDTQDPLIQKLVVDSFKLNRIPVYDGTDEYDEHYPLLGWDGNKLIQHAVHAKHPKYSLQDFMYKFGIGKPETIKVVLNYSYTAQVSRDTVEVGCQTFSHGVIKQLYEATLKMQNN
jgi:hypothetical protein